MTITIPTIGIIVFVVSAIIGYLIVDIILELYQEYMFRKEMERYKIRK